MQRESGAGDMTSQVEIIAYSSPNHGPRRLPVAMLVLHYTGMESAAAALARLCDPAAQVSAHYLVDEDGAVYGLVDEDRRAWHAGAGIWRGCSDINSASIGIELVNPGHEWGYRDFPEAQMAALERLCHGILARHAIAPRQVVGHSDVAPLRKQDPGERFGWARLAAAGIGLFPQPATAPGRDLGPGEAGEDVERFQAALATWGYGLVADGRYGPETQAVVTAFQRHFRPNRCDGHADRETRAMLNGVLAAAQHQTR